MSYVDIAIIVIVAICALIGLKCGIIKTVIGFFSWLISFVIAFFLTKIVAYALLDVGVFKDFVLGTGDGFSLYGWCLEKLPVISEAPGFVQSILNPLIKSIGESSVVSQQQVLALMVSYYIFCIMVFLGLFIAIRILMILFSMFAKSLSKDEKPGAVSRLLGFVVGAVRGFAYTALIFLIVTYLVTIPQLNFLGKEINESIVGKPVFAQVQTVSDKFLTKNDDETLEKLILLAGLKDDATPIEEDPNLNETENEDEENTGGNENNENTGGDESSDE